MPTRGRPPNRGPGKPSNRGVFAPKPQPQKIKATGTRHKGAAKPPPKKRGCCPMVAAVRSARRGRYRLARRYAVMSLRLIVAG